MPASSSPLTYVIDYAEHMKDADSYLAAIERSPPHLLHVGHEEVPFPNTWGALVRNNKGVVLISPGEMGERIEAITDFNQRLREAGVETLIPYICNQTIAGDPEHRRGIWAFYDRWEDYADFGFGPKPPDPMEWLAREEYGRPHYNYELRHKAFVPMSMQRYAPCPNNPHYRRYQKGVVDNIARVGYDGVFVDNCILNCYCMHCQSRFSEHIQDHFTAQEQSDFFGFEDPADIRLGTRGSRLHWVKTQPSFKDFLSSTFSSQTLSKWLGTDDPDEFRIEEGGNGWLWNMADRYLLWMQTRHSPRQIEEMFGFGDLSRWGIRDAKDRALWAETKLFWAKSVAENLKYIRHAGESAGSSFVILPNWGEMQLTDGNEFREEIGHDLLSWQPESDLVMFEESNEPGMITPGIYLDFILELKFSLANSVRGCILSHVREDPVTTELSYAECLAGLGSFIQAGAGFPDIRRKYREFIDSNTDLLEGWFPYHHVGLAYFYNQLHLENLSHMREVYKFTRYLSDQHLLFGFLTEEDLSPDSNPPCRIMIIPDVRYVSDIQLEGIESFLSGGGICIVTGDFAACDERARPREDRPSDRLSESYPGRFFHRQISDLIPDDNVSLDDARRLARTTWRTLNVPGGRGFEAMRHLDEELGIQRYLDGGELARIIGPELRLTPPRDSLGARFNAYVKGNDIALHVVNYNVDLLGVEGDRSLEVIDSVQATVPLPSGFTVNEATSSEPGIGSASVDWSQRGESASLKMENLRLYRMVLLRGSR